MPPARSPSSAAYEAIRNLALALADVEETTSYGTPAFKVKGKLFIRLRDDLDAIVLKTTFERREELLESDPDAFFITDHYINFPWILVRLATVERRALRPLVRAGYEAALPANRRSRR